MNTIAAISSLTAEDLALIKEISKVAWETLPSKLKSNAVDLAQSAWAKVVWKKEAESYFSALFQRISTTRLLGHPKEIRIGDIFTDVYIYDSPLSTKRRSPKGLDAVALRAKRFDDEQSRLPAKAILDNHRIYLTGKPGAGKTTLIRYLAIQSISKKGKTTPIYLILKDVVESAKEGIEVDLWSSITAQFKVCNLPSVSDFVEKLFDSGRATLLLDGLDEVSERNLLRHALITQIQAIATTYPKLQVIITCRSGADTFTFDKFAAAQIADFAPEQQLAFVKRWYSGDAPALQSFIEQWADAQNAGLRDLASTPLLLALLCIGYDETREFPLRRGDMYKEAAEALLRRWSVSRGIVRDNPYRKLTASRKEQMLAFMAYRLFKNSHFLFTGQTACRLIESFMQSLPRREVDDNVEPSEVLLNLEAAHGLVVHETADYLAFSHLTIHEYFTARYLIDSTNEQLLRQELTFETIVNRQWREVILLAIGSATTADYILSIIRAEIIRALAAEPNLRRILRLMTESKDPSPIEVWGTWTSTLQNSGSYDATPPYTLTLAVRGLSQAMVAASFSTAVTRKSYYFSENLTGSHACYLNAFLKDAPETRREKFLNVIYAEEIYAHALAVGTLGDRISHENKALTFE